ncbi:malonyl-CoA decarboxylase, mitochondrial-like [Physella acuta]|uniref:malonyl-CoA decarboxylase, mitochondrial-like n=1 Tax=Physella acuta TaxID=109671 RepID=UPI0027DB10BA|nr:malonyl-CoA decarboxylase, mitochondrial-like [Physella acuta]XP_059141348.1 malonyl-CoA decarboxylase, mitochondrial-like [Physella acuta]XP_059141349.1 malonyl-CoA decarboxylase, mitochondrial-like [Physella acuta]XP_059141350.1 malonyl-CoA decarboxylase, mitochondrial-like [Physella acuta]
MSIIFQRPVHRLKQIFGIFQHHKSSSAMRNLLANMYCSSSGTSMLQLSFADIEANNLTSEEKCNSFIEYYKKLPSEQRGVFLCELAKSYGIDKNSVVSVANSVLSVKDKDNASFLLLSERMRSALRPKYKTFFSHMGRVKGGVKFLVDMRADVLNFKQSTHSELNGALYQELNNALKELLMLWFTVGFLNLERITWNSPCDLVQKVSNYEAVHRIRTWEDIKRRVGPYRRCYIFTHNSMPREPVVVLHTALTSEISSSIHSIIMNARFRPSQATEAADNSVELFSGNFLSPRSTTPATPTSPTVSSILTQTKPFIEDEKEDLSQIKCAVFYSITSTQKGLQGVEMGNYLIKSVVRKLQEEFPHLQQFSSLSPIPGFRDWLVSYINHSINMRNAGEGAGGIPVLFQDESEALVPYQKAGQHSALDTFKDLILSHEWYLNEGLTQAMKSPLMRLCADYLYVQKRRNYALNPVANFHLSNGAVLWRINYLADTSQRGLNQSCGLMVNYRYFLESTETNSRNYLDCQIIKASPGVIDLLRGTQYTAKM